MSAISTPDYQHVSYLSNLLSSGWTVVGYHVASEDAVNQHFVLVQKDAELRSYRFYESRLDKIAPTGIGYNGSEVVLAKPHEGNN